MEHAWVMESEGLRGAGVGSLPALGGQASSENVGRTRSDRYTAVETEVLHAKIATTAADQRRTISTVTREPVTLRRFSLSKVAQIVYGEIFGPS